MIPLPANSLSVAKFKKDFEMSFVELKKSYVELFRALDSYGYLSEDVGVVLSGLRAGLSADMVSRVFKSAKSAKTPKEKKAKVPKTPKEKKAKVPKATSRVASAYMCFLADKRAEIRDLLKEATPDMSAKDLNLSVMRKAGEIWKAMSVDEKSVYVSQSASLKLAKVSAGEAPVVQAEVSEEVVEVQEKAQAEVKEEAHEEAQEEEVEAQAEVKEEVAVAEVSEVEIQEEAEVEAQEEEVEDETDEDVLTYNASFNVWVHEVSGMYYGLNDIESEPLGQLKSGKLVPFKKPSGGKRTRAN